MATFYIGPTGSDTTGDGSEGNPWFNLFFAISGARTAQTDTIIVKEGTYLQTVGINPGSIGSRTIKSENLNPEATVLDFGGVVVQWISGDAASSIEGIKFLRMRAADTKGRSVFSNFGGQYIRKCIFEDCSGANSGRGRGGLFEGGTTTIDRCLFINCWSNASGDNDGGIFSSSGVNDYVTTVLGCLFYFDANVQPAGRFIPSIIVFGDGSEPREVVVKNSILSVKDGTTNFVDTLNNSGTATVSFCCVHNGNYTAGGTGVITTDPLFVDPDNGNFNLRPTSPCIGTGTLL